MECSVKQNPSASLFWFSLAKLRDPNNFLLYLDSLSMTNYCLLPDCPCARIHMHKLTRTNTFTNILTMKKNVHRVVVWVDMFIPSKWFKVHEPNECANTHRTHTSSIFHRNSCAFICKRWSRRIQHITLKYQTITGHDDCMITGEAHFWKPFSFRNITLFSICARVTLCCVVLVSFARALSLCPFPLYLSYSIHQNSLRASVANTVFLVQFKNDNIIFDNILHSDNNSNKNYAILWWSIKYEWKNKARTNLSFLNMTTSETFAPNYAVARMYHTHNHIYIYF